MFRKSPLLISLGNNQLKSTFRTIYLAPRWDMSRIRELCELDRSEKQYETKH